MEHVINTLNTIFINNSFTLKFPGKKDKKLNRVSHFQCKTVHLKNDILYVCVVHALAFPVPCNYANCKNVIHSFHTVLYSINSICSRVISFLRALICWLVRSWFTITLFLILRARLAYLRVFRVSMKSLSEGLTHAIMTVWLNKKTKRTYCFLVMSHDFKKRTLDLLI